MNCLNRFTCCFSSYNSLNEKKLETTETESSVSPIENSQFEILENTKFEEVRSNQRSDYINEIREYLFNNQTVNDDLTRLEKDFKKDYWFSKYFSSFKSTLNDKKEERLDKLQFDLVTEASIEAFEPKDQNRLKKLKAKQLEINLLHQGPLSNTGSKGPLSNTGSNACWVNTALETLKLCFPSIEEKNQVQVPELMKFSQGLNVDSDDLRKEVRRFIDGDSKRKITTGGIVTAYGDPNDILEGLCKKLGLESESMFFFNTSPIYKDTSPQELMQDIIRSGVPPVRDQFIMTISRGLNEDYTMKRCTCKDLFTPFKILDSPINPSYQPLAITCDVGAHFVSFQKIGTNWYLRDDLNVLQNRLDDDYTINQKPDLKKAIQLNEPCYLDKDNKEKTWKQYIKEKVVNVLFEKVPT